MATTFHGNYMLKSCPFCGSDASLYETFNYELYVKCTNEDCCCRMYENDNDNADGSDLIKRWNTRKDG